jgi:hypothetical protein
MTKGFITEMKNNMDGYNISEFEIVWSMWVDVKNIYIR